MEDFNIIRQKLKELYIDILQEEFIFSKKEAIDFFETYNFDDDEEIEILPINIDEDDIDDDLEDEDETLFYSEHIIDDLDCYPDNQYFMIDVPENIGDKIYSEDFKQALLSDEFTNEERNQVFQVLIEKTLKYSLDPRLNIDEKITNQNYNFINKCSSNDFIERYINDLDFSEYVFKIYNIVVLTEKEENRCEKNTEEIITLNDLVREKFVRIHNKNICQGTPNSDSILIILNYLNGKIGSSIMNSMYESELNDLDLKDIGRNYIKRVIITDYLRSCEINYRTYEELYSRDYEYLEYIDNNDINKILERFQNDSDFAFDMIGDFIELNSYCSLRTKKSCKNLKLIKKVNSLYFLDFMTNKDY